MVAMPRSAISRPASRAAAYIGLVRFGARRPEDHHGPDPPRRARPNPSTNSALDAQHAPGIHCAASRWSPRARADWRRCCRWGSSARASSPARGSRCAPPAELAPSSGSAASSGSGAFPLYDSSHPQQGRCVSRVQSISFTRPQAPPQCAGHAPHSTALVHPAAPARPASSTSASPLLDIVISLLQAARTQRLIALIHNPMVPRLAPAIGKRAVKDVLQRMRRCCGYAERQRDGPHRETREATDARAKKRPLDGRRRRPERCRRACRPRAERTSPEPAPARAAGGGQSGRSPSRRSGDTRAATGTACKGDPTANGGASRRSRVERSLSAQDRHDPHPAKIRQQDSRLPTGRRRTAPRRRAVLASHPASAAVARRIQEHRPRAGPQPGRRSPDASM